MTVDDLEFVPIDDETLEARYEGFGYKIAVAELVCSCDGTLEPSGFVTETAVEGVHALGLGVTCDTCGRDELHIAYPGEKR